MLAVVVSQPILLGVVLFLLEAIVAELVRRVVIRGSPQTGVPTPVRLTLPGA
jgi:hypothetical protein